ncbi:MAG TPA: sigma factor-like helix-turn-helix DNA-binding protein, partial [Polyangiaceae bacterium]|nr:sigma factor-like helix-turn-helix DNA-binding protein [Polyangiaceae bacterium]
SRDMSLDAESPTHGGTGLERLQASGPSPEDEAGAAERGVRARAELVAAISELSPRERFIVEERWSGDDPVTLEHLGQRLGVSKERVRQIEERMRAKLRVRLASLEGAAADAA